LSENAEPNHIATVLRSVLMIIIRQHGIIEI
jgi:hypothetical protein